MWKKLSTSDEYNETLRYLIDFEFCGNNYRDVRKNLKGYQILYYEFEPNIIMGFGYWKRYGQCTVLGYAGNKFDMNILAQGLLTLFSDSITQIYVQNRYGFEKIFGTLCTSMKGEIWMFEDTQTFVLTIGENNINDFV